MTDDAIKQHLRTRCATAPIDGKAFTRPVAACTLPECRGMCCYDGVYVDAPTEAAIQALVGARRPAFAAMGLDLPPEVIVTGDWKGIASGRKTARKPWNASAAVADYPRHFTQTSCVFHLDDGRCGLQVLAIQDGVHPWTYKPHPCWLFPIFIQYGTITIYDEAIDPSRHEGYDGFIGATHCGRTCLGGRPALEVLAHELRYLGDIIGRDLIGEADDQVAT